MRALEVNLVQCSMWLNTKQSEVRWLFYLSRPRVQSLSRFMIKPKRTLSCNSSKDWVCKHSHLIVRLLFDKIFHFRGIVCFTFTKGVPGSAVNFKMFQIVLLWNTLWNTPPTGRGLPGCKGDRKVWQENGAMS